jgi:5'-deoxynucleotidase
MSGISHFFAYLGRMRFIQRWGIMRNTCPENIQEHSLQVAMVAHALALIGRRRCGGTLDPERVAVLALFHEVGEVITGDLASPIKYFNPEIKAAYRRLEQVASQKLSDMLPAELQADYRPLLFPQVDEAQAWRLVKVADKICAYLKCREELKAGNQEFARAEKAVAREIESYGLPEVDYFMAWFAPSFSLTLDELN